MFDMNYRKRNRFTPKREGSILTSFTMTIKTSALIQHTSIQSSVCRVSGSWLDFMNVRNISSSAGALSKRPVTYLFGSGRRNVPVKCKSERLLVAKYSTTAPRWNKLPTTTASPPCGEKRGLLRKAVFAALGLSTTAAVCVHTSVQVTMAQGTESLRVNLESAEADWKETKDRMLSLQTDERRRFYRTRGYESLDQIPVWMPSAVPNEGGRPLYPRNKRLDGKISLHTGDITRLEVDAIVNAANKTLLGGGGVDGAIHRAAGPQLKEECATLLGCETGRAKVTGGYGLPARRVIHTVGPIVTGPLVTGPIVSEPVGGQDRAALRACYRSALEVASMPHVNARSLAFPCISTGVYGYPPDQGVHVALATVREYLDEHPDKLDRVIFCVFLPADRDLYLKSLPLYFPGAAAVVKSKL